MSGRPEPMLTPRIHGPRRPAPGWASLRWAPAAAVAAAAAAAAGAVAVAVAAARGGRTHETLQSTRPFVSGGGPARADSSDVQDMSLGASRPRRDWSAPMAALLRGRNSGRADDRDALARGG